MTRFPTSHGMRRNVFWTLAPGVSSSLFLSRSLAGKRRGFGGTKRTSPLLATFGLDGSFTGQNRFRTDSYVRAAMVITWTQVVDFPFRKFINLLSSIMPPRWIRHSVSLYSPVEEISKSSTHSRTIASEPYFSGPAYKR